MALLEVRNLSKRFGGLVAISDLNLDIDKGEILGLIGPNGAGKTTLFNLITGIDTVTRGKIVFGGEDITRLQPHKIVERGITRAFQTAILFHNLPALTNVVLGYHLQAKMPVWESLLNTPRVRAKEGAVLQKSLEILNFVGLGSLAGELAKNLPHGHQKALGIAIALAAAPKLLLLDEPATGLSAEETVAMIELISTIRERGITVLVVEHHMRVIMGLCDRIIVLNFGKKIADGLPEEVRENKDVIEAYLGVEEDVA